MTCDSFFGADETRPAAFSGTPPDAPVDTSPDAPPGMPADLPPDAPLGAPADPPPGTPPDAPADTPPSTSPGASFGVPPNVPTTAPPSLLPVDSACAPHDAFMREALVQAQRAAERGEIPVGAVLARDGVILARAHNLCETLRDATAHAEMLALREGARVLGDWRLTGCTLYVTLEPCAMCAGAAGLARLSGIWFGARDPRMGCCGSVYRIPADEALAFHTPTYGGLLAPECAALLRAFFARRRADAAREKQAEGAACPDRTD